MDINIMVYSRLLLLVACINLECREVAATEWWQAPKDFGGGPFEIVEVPSVLQLDGSARLRIAARSADQVYDIRIEKTKDGRLQQICFDKSCTYISKLFPYIAQIRLQEPSNPNGAILRVKGVGEIVGVAFLAQLAPAVARKCLVPIAWAQGMPSRVVIFWREDGRLVQVAAKRPFELEGAVRGAGVKKLGLPRFRCASDKVDFLFFDVTPDV